MVASLQNKKEALEAKLRDKTSELRKLCIEEAELTGFLPAETPLEPGQSPPHFRRRIVTTFTYPENLINRLKCKEDEALAALELECKIQTGIAEAALGLANDTTASKSVRRKHRVLYDESQRRLSDLEAKLATLRQAQPKQKKKPRPHTDYDDCEDVQDSFSRRPPVSTSSIPDRSSSSSIRHSHTYGGLQKPEQVIPLHHQRLVQSHMNIPVVDHRHSMMDHHYYLTRSNNPSPTDQGTTWASKGRETWYNPILHHPQHVHSYHPNIMPDQYMVEPPVSFSDRFGSLDRSATFSNPPETDNRISATLPRNSCIPHSNTLVLLPNQTYPENSLIRTQSLGNMECLKQTDRKSSKEKEWNETSVDSSPIRSVSSKSSLDPPHHLVKPPEGKASPQLPSVVECSDDSSKANQASINSIQFDTVVPYESPKNHTVVQAGKWQPYREVTKPFEMSDFYKYSTKYRQQCKGPSPHGQVTELPAIQQKGIYKPPQPLECQPLASVSESSNNIHHVKSYQHFEPHPLPNNDMTNWYHVKNDASKPRSSTLV